MKVLDLSSNKLSEQNSLILLEYARDNVIVEQIQLLKNVHVNASIINSISEECRKNAAIK